MAPSATAPSLGRPPRRWLPWRIERPVFVVAPPRSGSTFLFECLLQFREFTTFADKEGTFLWRRVLPFEKRATVSDAIAPDEFGPSRRRQLKALLYARSLAKHPGLSTAQRLTRLVREPQLRYLDKSIANTFRLPLLREMFPDATFIYLVRDPAPNIASMLTSWSRPRFAKPTLTPYLRDAGSDLPHWTFAAPPGWRDQARRSLPEVCAWSWQQHAEAILRFREAGDPGPLLRYEDLVADPLGVVRSLTSALDLELTPRIVEYLEQPPPSRTTITPPGAPSTVDTAAQVAAVLPSVADTAARLGY